MIDVEEIKEDLISNVLIPRINMFLEKEKLDFLVVDLNFSEIMDMLEQKYGTIRKFLNTYGRYYTHNGIVFHVSYYCDMMGNGSLQVIEMKPSDIVYKLNRLAKMESNYSRMSHALIYAGIAILILSLRYLP